MIYQLEVIDDVGLVLYWQSRLEVDFEEVPPRQTLISAFVTDIEYHYYDSELELWELEEEPRMNTERRYDIPRRIKIVFEAGEEEPLSYVINLPNPNEGIPVF